MTTSARCDRCDKPPDPGYNGLCEDCWVDGSLVSGAVAHCEPTILGGKRRVDPVNGDEDFGHFKQAN